jgi:2-polyprenyl-6-methoxyphenol hydroxylase-like FAD-dependent oxidoreductase
MTRHAEVAGGGIGGLATGMMLARAGWSVRVHERSPEIRESGAGIYIRNNSIKVLEEFGVFDRLAPQGTRIEHWRIRDRTGRILQQWDNVGHSRLYVFPRQALIDAIAEGARAAGVEIVTNSRAVAAEAEGVLVLDGGKRLAADLVVAADGNRSQVRDSLGIGARYRELPTIINRHFIRGREIIAEPVSTQHWSGYRRIGITPCGTDHTYVYTVCKAGDEAGRRLPLDVADWTRSFPHMRRELDVIAAGEVTQYAYSIVRCPRWRKGRVAIIGDAAHGLPPTLGQGAGLTIMNARALVAALDHRPSVPEALDFWEEEVRFISDTTQRWSFYFDWFTREWPTALDFARPAIVWSFGHFRALNDRMRIADRGLELTALRP